MSETTDQPELDVRAAEAKGEDITIEWKGQTFTVPRDYGTWPFEFTLYSQKGLNGPAMEALLGPEQFARFLRSRPTNADFDAFDDRLGKALKMKPGESPASSD